MYLMGNKGIECLNQSSLRLEEAEVDQQLHSGAYSMDSPTIATPGSHRSSSDENPRVKFLCSFGGSILPRPQDGKLKHVGGETRIVSTPRDITYEDLMGRMRELFEGATILKYQQPDEDLDALVSVVNDDDVTNMMEEYDKLGSGDGFTRLRIFLFSTSDQDVSPHFVDGDERDNERRYVDALNSLNESPDPRKQHSSEYQVLGSVEDYNISEQYLNQMSLEGSFHNQRNNELPMPQINLRHLTIPQMGSGQHLQSITQMYNEMEAPWSPAYYSPGHHDPRPVMEYPASPSSSRYVMPYGELPDSSFDRTMEDYNRQQVNRQTPCDQPQLGDNLVWVQPGATSGDNAGFPGNVLHSSSMFEGNNICGQCRTPFPRNQAYSESPLKHGDQQHLEPPNMVNGFQQVNTCAECPPNRETLLLNTDARLQSPFYHRDQNDPRPIYAEAQNSERGWIPQPQSNARAEEPRLNVTGAGRLTDHYIVDANGMKIPLGHNSFPDGHLVSSHYALHEDHLQYMRSAPESNNEVILDQAGFAGSSQPNIPLEERGVRFRNPPYSYGLENFYQLPHGHVPAPHPLWRSPSGALHGTPSYDFTSASQQPDGTRGPGFFRGPFDGSPRFRVGPENQNPWVDSSSKMGVLYGSALPEYSHGQALNMRPIAYNREMTNMVTPEPICSPHEMLNFPTLLDPVPRPVVASTLAEYKLVSQIPPGSESRTELVGMSEESTTEPSKGSNYEERITENNMPCTSGLVNNEKPDDTQSPDAINSNSSRPAEQRVEKLDGNGSPITFEVDDTQVDHLGFIPEVIESMKKAAIQSVKGVNAEVQEHADSADVHETTAKEEFNDLSETVAKEEIRESEIGDSHGGLELGSGSDNLNNSKIEPTKAEAEAISRGLQTIKNDDLEEIRELGSGTYGAVYHGKWKGSDVAIKRIKASCFAGRPSERERLIADFWKEALILSSLHHPNVVSFYGIVRDGPDGSLATVTEFMINGSLKQFLQKKDRTIDRRKRLIIAMDAAFGMEYLHGKNIVHFDLKCENLLVNMRDPHRPVCKIGDLGLSKVKQHTLVSGGVRGTLPWMAPELLSGKSNMVTEKIDVYSFGIVMWELLTGEEPYADIHCASIIGGIVNDSLRPQIPTWCDPEWKSLMESCWASDPAQRPSFAEIAQRLRSMAAAVNVK